MSVKLIYLAVNTFAQTILEASNAAACMDMILTRTDVAAMVTSFFYYVHVLTNLNIILTANFHRY